MIPIFEHQIQLEKTLNFKLMSAPTTGLFSVAVSMLCGCLGCSPSPSEPAQSSGKPKIMTTTGMVRDLVEHVAGQHFQVDGLIGEGIDPHSYRPLSGDTRKLMTSDLIVYSGLKLEGNMQAAFEQATAHGNPAVAVTAGLPIDLLRHAKEFEGHPDPHVWGDVQLWMKCMDQVVLSLSEFSPDYAAEFQANAASYRDELTKLDAYAKEAIATIPEGNRHLVTAHDAFGYLSRAYGLQVRAVQGISTTSEAGVQDINNLVDFLVANKIPSIFVEVTVNSAGIDAVIEGAKQKGWQVTIGGTLYSDSLGTPGTYEGTYIGMMDANITTIVRALGGMAPERGFQDKLNR